MQRTVLALVKSKTRWKCNTKDLRYSVLQINFLFLGDCEATVRDGHN